jgi:hypothetical protein
MGKKQTNITVVRIKLRQKKTERLARRSFKRKRQRNIENNYRKRSSEVRQPKENNPFRLREVTVSAMAEFSLLEFPENVLSFIKKVDEVISNNKHQIIEFDISQITKLDIGSIGLLLSKINELSRLGIHTVGNFPKDEQCRQMIYESGFLGHMNDLKGRKIKLRQDNSNLMVNRGFDKTSNSLVGSAIRKSVLHLTGVEDTFRPLYSIAQEMCANSVEHANQQNKNWLFSVWYKDENNVCFTMTDIGSGILSTLKRKATQIIKELLLTDDIEILDRAFDKKYSSQTQDINRNKGLPKIKTISIENYVNNLTVITNNVLLDFTNNTNSKVLNKKLNGTFYYWELNKNCIETWKNRKL